MPKYLLKNEEEFVENIKEAFECGTYQKASYEEIMESGLITLVSPEKYPCMMVANFYEEYAYSVVDYIYPEDFSV